MAVALGPHDLTIGGPVVTGQLTGGVTGTTGRLLLTGTTNMFSGRLPEVVVTGNYTLNGNLLLKTPALVQQGGSLFSVGHETIIRHY